MTYETCEKCFKKITGIPFRVREENKMYKYNFVHQLCKRKRP